MTEDTKTTGVSAGGVKTAGPLMPSDMVEVSKDEFFALLAADKRDIMPRNEQRDYTTWEVVHARTRWGWSTPGWANPGAPKLYAAIAKAGQPS